MSRAWDTVRRGGLWAYYPWTRLLNRLLPPVRDDGVSLRVLPGVYRPLYGESRAAAQLCAAGERVLDVGSGCGILGLAAARRGCEVTAVDISPIAVDNTRLNAAALGLLDRVEVRQSDMYSAVDGRYDVILAHVPYIRLAMPGPTRQWATSRSFLESLLEGAKRHLTPSGRCGVIDAGRSETSIEELAAANGLRVRSRRSMRGAPVGQRLLRPLYFNVGFGVALYEVGWA